MISSYNPLHYPLCLQKPERLVTSAWIQHVPFAMFLIEAVQPKVLVELGTHAGVSYCAFCQAANSLMLDTKCYAVDTWVGDAQAGHYGSSILDDLKQHHDPMYSRFSTLLQSTFDEAAELFTTSSIDILHIDGFHTYESVKSDFYKWLPKMSDSGIVLLHDHCVYDGDFGVWKLWDELKMIYPSFEFTHGYGLAVIFVGKRCPESMEFLFHSDTETHDVLRSYFNNLGMRWQLEHDLRIHKLSQNGPGSELENENQSRITNYKRMVTNHGWNFLLNYFYKRLVGKA